MTQTKSGIPVWAIICMAITIWFCGLGLLFLLAKEHVISGKVQVTVQGDRFLHVVQLPVNSTDQVLDYNARVNYARSLAIAAS